MASEVNNYVGEDFLQYLYVLDANYEKKAIIDTFSDFLWTERYCGYGEFEITVPFDKDILQSCKINDYVMIRESDKLMVIDTIGISTDRENGVIITISGKTLESLLDRRIILDEVIGNIDDEGVASTISVQDAIRTILINNVISPAMSHRAIPKFTFKPSSDSRITKLTTESFLSRGENAYEKILSICKENDIGFKINAEGSGGFSFELYFGTDRTGGQDLVPSVVFSDSYENLSNSNYLQTDTSYKTAVYIEWQWESKTTTVNPSTGTESTEVERGDDMTEVYRGSNKSGLERRESYMVDTKVHDIGAKKDKTSAIKQVTDRGKEYLAGYKVTTFFDGETDPYRQFVYGVDYILGDIVQLENKYGQTGKCRITEILRSRDSSGASMVPTFESIEGDD